MTTPYPESPATMPAHNRDNARILREILQPNWSRLSSNDQRIAAEQVLLCLNSALLQYPSNYSSISAYRNGKLQGLPFPRARWLVLAIWLGEAALKNYDKRFAKKWRYAPWADMVPVKCPVTHLSKSEYNASRRCTAITQTPKDTRQQAASNAQVATEAAYEQVLTQAVSKPARGAPFAEKTATTEARTPSKRRTTKAGSKTTTAVHMARSFITTATMTTATMSTANTTPAKTTAAKPMAVKTTTTKDRMLRRR